MTPVTRPKQDIDPATRAELRKLARQRTTLDAKTRETVLAALDAGGSVRVVAEAAGLSTSTVQAWKASRATPPAP